MKFVLTTEEWFIDKAPLLSQLQIAHLLQVENELKACTTAEEAREIEKKAPDACFQHHIYDDVIYVVIIHHFKLGTSELL